MIVKRCVHSKRQEEGEEEKEGKSPQGVEVPPEKQKSTEAQSVSRARTLSGQCKLQGCPAMGDASSPPGMAPSPVGVPSGPGGPWDHRRLNQTQFIQMVELFLRDDPERFVRVAINLSVVKSGCLFVFA